jgi:hypothetical protein
MKGIPPRIAFFPSNIACLLQQETEMYKTFSSGSGLDASGSGQEPVAGPCEHGIHGNEPSGSIKGREFLD